MNPIAKWLMIAGAVLILAGLFWQMFGRILPLGKLPGDIVIERENMKIYFPIVTMILVSILLSILFSLSRFIK